MALLAVAGQVVASAVLDPLLERAISAAAGELQLISGVPREIEKLTLTLTLVNRVLEDAEERQVREPAIRDWLRHVKQAFFDADDLLDEYATRRSMGTDGGPSSEKVGATMLLRCCVCISRTMTGRALAHRIHGINQRLDHLAHVKNQFGLHVLPAGNSTVSLDQNKWRRQTSSLLADESSVVGRDNEKGMIVELLLSPPGHHESAAESSDNRRSFSVLPIVGMGGIGKTTVARLAFNDERVKKHFELRMWVCVSTDFDLTRLTKDMIESASASKGNSEPCQIYTHWDLMQQKLRQEVEGRTFLLVLDDVWEGGRSLWDDLFEPLNFAKEGSKGLITTRSRGVVGIKSGRMRPVVMGGLSDADLWLLFKRYAFAGSTPEECVVLEEIGRQIAMRLKGLPLAAKTIGSLLNTSLEVNHWREVMKSEMWKLQQDEDGILPTLGLSYRYLPGDLKQCFAYCSLFPKDYAFAKTELARLWTAQGFTRSKRCTRLPLEDMGGGEYFDNLLYRSFFEPSGSSSYDYVSRSFDCDHAMHDLIHDLAEYVSGDDCFRWEDEKPTTRIPDTVRHISVNTTKFDRPRLNQVCGYEKLRSLVFLRRYQFDDLTTRALGELFLRLKRLRVLSLCDCGITQLPNSIGDLKHLRYIDLSLNPLERLPESVGNLHNLQVLKLVCCGSLCAFPTRTSELTNLRHLAADYESISTIGGLGELTCLQELEVRGRKVRELGGMAMLRKLDIWWLVEMKTKEHAAEARLHSKEHLQVLRLEWGGARSAATSLSPEAEEEILQALRPGGSIKQLSISRYGGARSPSWMGDPMTWASFPLESVRLNDCPNWEVLPPFGQLRLLKSLRITSMSSVKWLDPGPFFFPSLEELAIDDLPQWEGWWGHGDAPSFFPRLRELSICGCRKLRELPALPPTLRDLVLENVGLTCLPGLWGCRRAGDDADTTSPSSCSSRACRAALLTVDIRDCPNLTSVSGLLRHHLTALEELHIRGCEELVSLPKMGFGHFVSLKELNIYRCPKLTCLSARGEGHPPPPPPPPPPVRLPRSLERLKIENCGDLMGGWWWAALQNLTSLVQLSLDGCPSTVASFFVSLGLHEHHLLAATLTELEIRHCGGDCLQAPSACTSTSPPPAPPHPSPSLLRDTGKGFGALTSLTELKLFRSLNVLRECGHGGLPSSLQLLMVDGDDGDNHEWLSTCLRDLTSLKQLSLQRIQNLRSLPSTLSCLSSLETLEIHGCPRIQSLSEIDLPTSLKMLSIVSCGDLRSLPSTLSCLSSLETLEIQFCPAIGDLPGMGLPASLQKLSILCCPALEERCRDQGAPEWNQISCIPEVHI